MEDNRQGGGGDAASERHAPVPFDRDNPDHLAALRTVARIGPTILGGTEGVINVLRDDHGIIADRDVAFEVLCMATERGPRGEET